MSVTADHVRAAIERCIATSPAAPTTDDIAAAALWAAAEQIEHHWDGAECVDHLQAVAAELNGTDYGNGEPPTGTPLRALEAAQAGIILNELQAARELADRVGQDPASITRPYLDALARHYGVTPDA